MPPGAEAITGGSRSHQRMTQTAASRAALILAYLWAIKLIQRFLISFLKPHASMRLPVKSQTNTMKI
jgi:hypothetical protein